jgi:hypothetical protein
VCTRGFACITLLASFRYIRLVVFTRDVIYDERRPRDATTP